MISDALVYSHPSTIHSLRMILLPPDGPSPHPHAPSFLTPHPGPPVPTPASPQNAVISPEDDVQRLFNVCKVGRGNAELLNEVLVYAKPQELRNEITKVRYSLACSLSCVPSPIRGPRNSLGAPGHPMSSSARKSHGPPQRLKSRDTQQDHSKRPRKSSFLLHY